MRLDDRTSLGSYRTGAVAALTAHSAATGLTTGDDHTQYLLESTVTAKGDLLVATASATITNLAVGSNGLKLVADSAQSTGVKWA